MKKWIAWMVALLLCLSMAGCGESQQEQSTPNKVQDFSGMTLKLGNQMPDFTVRDVDGTEYGLYDLLEQKQMVMLNFWFIDCPYCVMEFPHMDAAYGQYGDSVEILAMNPFDSDEDIQSFGKEEDLHFALCGEDLGLSDAFGVRGYPTTVIIDRFGIVCLVQAGAVPYEEVFLQVFAHFTADSYETELFNSITEIGN